MARQGAQFFQLDQLRLEQSQAGKCYLEFLRVPAMSAGMYVLPAGGTDPQQPHKEDEMYYVVRGRAKMSVDGPPQAKAGPTKLAREVGEGSLIFVPAGVEHRFHDIEEELVVLVFFAPAES
jgi:mannose-6-phosphate isomerase-like protein (cupin superfamily)